MTRRKTPAPRPPEPIVDLERDEFGTGRPLSRKQVVEVLRRRESLAEADLRGADLSGVSFDGANLVNAKFADANLAKATFRNANMVGASFFGANLKDAVLDGADLEEADFDYAFLDGVTLRGAKTRKAIFPRKRVSPDDVREAVRTGKRLEMEPIALEDE